MGNSAPVPVGEATAAATVVTNKDLPVAMSDSTVGEGVDCAVVPPPTPHVSLNLDRLRKIFQTLSSINENKAEESEVEDQEPLQMRRTFQSIFERFERRFTTRTSSSRPKKRPKTLRISREKLIALLSKRSSNVSTTDDSKTMRNWARTNLNRLTTSMRHVKSDSFLARKITGRSKSERSRAVQGEDDDDRIHLPSMKTKKRSSVSRSKALITTASEAAHKDLVKHLEKNSSQHCLDELDFRNFEYPFENLVFEGGGAKVHTYIGAIKVRERFRERLLLMNIWAELLPFRESVIKVNYSSSCGIIH